MPVVLASFSTNLTEYDVYRFKVALDLAGPPFLASNLSDFEPDYIWSEHREGVTLGQAARVAHGFPIYNFTLPLRCDAAPGSSLDDFYSKALPPDVPVVNAAMYGAPGRAGYLVSALTREDWVWGELSGASTSVLGGSSAGGGYAFLARLGAIFRLLCTYFLVSTTTALLLRFWVVALPAFMYPVLACIGRWTFVPPDPRVLDDHFPWVGGYAAAARLQDEAAVMEAAELEAAAPPEGGGGLEGGVPPGAVAEGLQAGLMAPGGGGGGVRQRRGAAGGFLGSLLAARRAPPGRLARGAASAIFWAHLQQLFLALLLYEAMTGFAGALAFTYKSFPSELAYLVWTVALIAEAFSAVFARSLLTMTVFPRAHFLLFAAFYYYWVAFAYPFATAAAVAYLLAVVALMLGCVIAFEAPAFAAGRISASRPRAVLVLLPTAVVGTGGGDRGPLDHWAAPPLWSLFMRATFRPAAPEPEVAAYDVAVPPVPGGAGGPGGAEGGDGAAAEEAAAAAGGQRLGGGRGVREAAIVRLIDGDVIQAPQ